MSQKQSERGGLHPSAPNAAPTKGLDVTHCISDSRPPSEKPRSLVWAERRAACGLDDEDDRATIRLGRVLDQGEPLLAQAPPAKREAIRLELSRVLSAPQAEEVFERLRGELGRAS